MYAHLSRRSLVHLGLGLCAGALAGIGMTGCEPSFYDPRVFDDLKGETWVSASAAPEGIGGSAYGVAMAAGGAPGAGASFLVAGRLEDGFGLLDFDPGGQLNEASVDLYVVNSLDLPNGWLVDPVMVGDPDSTLIAVNMSNGGTPADPAQATVALMDSRTGQTSGLFSLLGPELVRDMAFGLTDAPASGADNLVVARTTQLELIADTADAANTAVHVCGHGLQTSMSVVVADLDSSAPGQEIAFAAHAGTTPSAVQILSGSTVSDAAATATPPDIAPCFDATRLPLGELTGQDGEIDFGADMVVADFNGNGALDLAVGATESGRIYVYLDLDLANGAPAPLVVDGAALGPDFGGKLAAGDIFPGAGDELIAAMPDAAFGGKIQAGKVAVYEFSGLDFLEPVELSDASAEAGLGFGRSVAVVPFGQDRHILAVGSNTEVYTYFRIRAADPDARP